MFIDKILEIGKYLFPLSFLMYVGLHLEKPEVGASFVPGYLPFPFFWNYFTAFCIVCFILSALTRKFDKAAYTAMAIYVILMALLVHLPRALATELPPGAMTGSLGRETELEMVNVFRNVMLSGALLGYARYVAADPRLPFGL